MNEIFDKLGLEQNFTIRTIKTESHRIILPEIFGFCGGVIGALRILERIIEINKKNILNARKASEKTLSKSKKSVPSIYLLGEIIHNSTVNQVIADADVRIIPESDIDTVFDVAEKDDYIVIPAFGIPLGLERKIRKQYTNVVDTTCKNVKSVWSFISHEGQKGSTILLYGKPGHPEVRASISRAENDNCIIILPNLEAVKSFSKFIGSNEFENLDEAIKNVSKIKNIRCYNGAHFNSTRFALASQTTMLYGETLNAEKIIRAAIENKGGALSVCNTICKATYLRQQAALEICRQHPDLILVVGGYESSNTQHLYELAKKYSPVYYLKDAEAIGRSSVTYFDPQKGKEFQVSKDEMFKDVSVVAILGGASCPFTVIHGIIEKLKMI